MSEDQPKLSKEKIQMFHDEQTIFALAVLMMDIHTGTLLKNKNLVANSFMKAGVILRNNKGFPERFKKTQQAIIAQMKQKGPPQPGTTPLPTDVAFSATQPKMPTLSILKNEEGEEHA